jgi:hypothetical protein
MYGGANATAYFVRRSRKASWFTQVPVLLTNASGIADFGNTWSVNISRAGDYMLQNWLRVTLPEVKQDNGDTSDDTNGASALLPGEVFRWTRNLMHNLVKEACIKFNDLVEARFDSEHLDFLTAFTVPQSKRNGYNNMIGNLNVLTNPVATAAGRMNLNLPPLTLNLPLPFPHTRDSGVALPTAALPYNEMRMEFEFRPWQELLIKDTYDGAGELSASAPATQADVNKISGAGSSVNLGLKDVQVWANYAIVSNEERKLMGKAPRDILIEQVQTDSSRDVRDDNVKRDIRFSHAVKTLFFGIKNVTNRAEHSNYTCSGPSGTVAAGLDFSPIMGTDPIEHTSVRYENTVRLSEMGSDYFSLVQPYYQCADVAIPEDTGYHMYSYSLDMLSLDPMGSTNFGKLTNVQLEHKVSADCSHAKDPAWSSNAIKSSDALPATVVNGLYTNTTNQQAGLLSQQRFETVCSVVSNNVVRVSGGALGFPVL